ncbi:ATP-binding protein [Streptomyces sp. NBC_01443]|uniref:ATP-binding protein n=1 Tax=Streptomyces sp. NBC_01443 TaxID=2903868 RepID=UPI0022524201|nr:ATP-binding protein [Streptomyces sp. NBC_01443]MCX4632921.1 ATP-binding protein [Streptomyces sp. NBC_01443]
MNVHHMAWGTPCCSTAPPAPGVREGAAQMAQKACMMTESSFAGPDGREPGAACFEATFSADRAAIAPVRRRLRGRLQASGLEEIADDVALASHELMANAVVHGCRSLPESTELTVTAAWTGDQLRVAVHDPSNEQPREQHESGSRQTGRGLTLVRALADRWGVEPDSDGRGKSVWMELDLPFHREVRVA